MELSGQYDIPAPPDTVWKAINDPNVLGACIPGCESIVKTDDTHFEAAARLKIGPVSATFKGKVALEELNPPHRCVLTGEGQGGVAGFAKGEAEVLLTPSATGTLLTYTAKANIGGKLAQIGQRLIAGAAKQIADDFFARFAEIVGKNANAGVLAAASEAPHAAADGDMAGVSLDAVMTEPPVMPDPLPVQASAAAADTREGVGPETWMVGLVAVIVILLVLFGLVL